MHQLLEIPWIQGHDKAFLTFKIDKRIFYSTKTFFVDYIWINGTLIGRQFDLKGLADATYLIKNVTIS